MKYLTAAIMIFISSGHLFGRVTRTVPDPVLVDSAYNLFISGEVYLSGQPMEDHFSKLHTDGVTLVINIRTKPEMDNFKTEHFDEELVVKDLGMDYFQIGVGGADGYHPGVIDEIAAKITAAKGKVLIHCAAAGRATMVWMAWLVQSRQCSIDEAFRLGKEARFSFPFEELLGYPLTIKKTK